ncbi:MAG: hypothetical protein ABIS44_05280, partial [Mycobacteriales bacterium]
CGSPRMYGRRDAVALWEASAVQRVVGRRRLRTPQMTRLLYVLCRAGCPMVADIVAGRAASSDETRHAADAARRRRLVSTRSSPAGLLLKKPGMRRLTPLGYDA